MSPTSTGSWIHKVQRCFQPRFFFPVCFLITQDQHWVGCAILIHPVSPVFLQEPAASNQAGCYSLGKGISGHHEGRGMPLKNALPVPFPLPHPGWITSIQTNVQASWGSQHHFQKEACLMHGTFGVLEKFMKCLTAFSRRTLSRFSSNSLHSVIVRNMWSHGVCIYTSHKPFFFYSIGVYRLLWGTRRSHRKVTHRMPPPRSTSVWLQDSCSWSHFL